MPGDSRGSQGDKNHNYWLNALIFQILLFAYHGGLQTFIKPMPLFHLLIYTFILFLYKYYNITYYQNRMNTNITFPKRYEDSEVQ